MQNDFILVLDFGGAQAMAMARKLRGQNVYCEIHSGAIAVESIRKKAPRGILLAGGPSQRPFDESVLDLGVPVLAMGDCARKLAQALGASCEGALLTNRASQIEFLPCPLFDGLGESDRFFERIDALQLPEGCEAIAATADGLTPAFADLSRRLYGLQFYAETNDPDGARILMNFAVGICGCDAFWSPEYYIENEKKYLREKIGDSEAIMAISGGVDSTVCAMLLNQTIGDRLKCVFVDSGLLRKGEAETVAHDFRERLGMELIVVDARERVLEALAGIEDPAEKRRAIQRQFSAAIQLEASAHPNAEYVIEGTIYSDLLSNPAERGEGGLKRIEPLRMLFKDEVRYVGETLGVPKELLNRQSFPGAGLAVRIMGEVTEEKLVLLREADAIFRAEIVEAGLDRKLSHYFVILTDMLLPGLRSGRVTREYACALRAVVDNDASGVTIAKLPYDLFDRAVQQIIAQVPGINHVLYDITGKPSAFCEWE